MKKIILFLMIFITIFSFCSCGKKSGDKELNPDNETTNKIVNPMVESGKGDIKNKTGIDFKLPEKAKNESYYMINDEIGQVGFDIGKKNYTLRAKKAEAADDFSGYYYVWTEEKDVKVNGNEAQAHIYSGEEGDYGTLIWFDKDSKTALTLSVIGKTTPEDLVKTAESLVG